MKKCNSDQNFVDVSLGISISDLLFAYRKETARVLKLSNGTYASNLSQAFDNLKNKGYLTSDEADNLYKCAIETIRARTGSANIKRTLVLLQNTSAKALINGNKNNLYLNYLNLCIGLVREADDRDPLPDNVQTMQSQSHTLPAGSGAAILVGAGAGAVIGGSIGGWPGAAIGAAVGALVGSSNDIEVEVEGDVPN